MTKPEIQHQTEYVLEVSTVVPAGKARDLRTRVGLILEGGGFVVGVAASLLALGLFLNVKEIPTTISNTRDIILFWDIFGALPASMLAIMTGDLIKR